MCLALYECSYYLLCCGSLYLYYCFAILYNTLSLCDYLTVVSNSPVACIHVVSCVDVLCSLCCCLSSSLLLYLLYHTLWCLSRGFAKVFYFFYYFFERVVCSLSFFLYALYHRCYYLSRGFGKFFIVILYKLFTKFFCCIVHFAQTAAAPLACGSA